MSAPVDEILVAGTFRVDIEDGRKGSKETDDTWLRASGGAIAIEMDDVTTDGNGRRKFKPGSQYVTDLTLTGYVTSTRRKALIDWINETVAGREPRRNVVVIGYDRNGKEIRRDRYEDCYLARICLPRLSAGSAEPIEEVVVIKPTRYASA